MSEWNSPILVALIGAISAIIIALINCYGPVMTKNRKSRKKGKKQSGEKKISMQKKLGDNEKCWIMIMLLFVPWIIVSPFLYGWLIGLLNIFILIPIVTVIIAIVKPIKLGIAVFSVLALHSFNLYLTEYAYQSITGLVELVSDASKAYYSSLIATGFFPYFLTIILGNILIIFAINRYRIRRS